MAGGMLKDIIGARRLRSSRPSPAKVTAGRRRMSTTSSSSPRRPAARACWRSRTRSKDVEDPFLKKGLQLAIDGTDPEELREILEAEIAAKKAERQGGGQDLHATWAATRPTIGIIGTVIGLIHVLENLSEPDEARPAHRRRVRRHPVGRALRQRHVAADGQAASSGVSELEVRADGAGRRGHHRHPGRRQPARRSRRSCKPCCRRRRARPRRRPRDAMSGTVAARQEEAQGRHEEEHENHERWLVTYADMMTLLMVLFIVLFAISQVDQKKFDGAARTAWRTASVRRSVASRVERGAHRPGHSDSTRRWTCRSRTVGRRRHVAEQGGEMARGGRRSGHGAGETSRPPSRRRRSSRRSRRRSTTALTKQGLARRGQVHASTSAAWSSRSSPTRSSSTADSADAAPGGQRIAARARPGAALTAQRPVVDGHTNQLPASPKYYPSGWELSATRASHRRALPRRAPSIAENRLDGRRATPTATRCTRQRPAPRRTCSTGGSRSSCCRPADGPADSCRGRGQRCRVRAYVRGRPGDRRRGAATAKAARQDATTERRLGRTQATDENHGEGRQGRRGEGAAKGGKKKLIIISSWPCCCWAAARVYFFLKPSRPPHGEAGAEAGRGRAAGPDHHQPGRRRTTSSSAWRCRPPAADVAEPTARRQQGARHRDRPVLAARTSPSCSPKAARARTELQDEARGALPSRRRTRRDEGAGDHGHLLHRVRHPVGRPADPDGFPGHHPRVPERPYSVRAAPPRR